MGITNLQSISYVSVIPPSVGYSTRTHTNTNTNTTTHTSPSHGRASTRLSCRTRSRLLSHYHDRCRRAIICKAQISAQYNTTSANIHDKTTQQANHTLPQYENTISNIQRNTTQRTAQSAVQLSAAQCSAASQCIPPITHHFKLQTNLDNLVEYSRVDGCLSLWSFSVSPP